MLSGVNAAGGDAAGGDGGEEEDVDAMCKGFVSCSFVLPLRGAATRSPDAVGVDERGRQISTSRCSGARTTSFTLAVPKVSISFGDVKREGRNGGYGGLRSRECGVSTSLRSDCLAGGLSDKAAIKRWRLS